MFLASFPYNKILGISTSGSVVLWSFSTFLFSMVINFDLSDWENSLVWKYYCTENTRKKEVPTMRDNLTENILEI